LGELARPYRDADRDSGPATAEQAADQARAQLGGDGRQAAPVDVRPATSLLAGQSAVRAAFADHVGGAPTGVWAAPARVNLIGEHTDYNDGHVLPLAIDRYLVLAARRREDDELRVRSLDHGGSGTVTVRLGEVAPGVVTGWPAYVAGMAWALRAAGYPVGGADIVIHSGISPGAGLSSSAALECAAGRALADLYGMPVSGVELAVLGQRAENEIVGVPVGAMDQLASANGQPGRVLLIDTRTLRMTALPFDLTASGLRLLVIDTHAPHRLADGDYAARRASCERAAAALGVPALRDVSLAGLPVALSQLASWFGPRDLIIRQVRHVVTENGRVLRAAELLRRGQLEQIGQLLTASHRSLRDDFQVSVPELDTAVDAALAAGALGARMTGAGFGGSVIALVPAVRQRTVVAAIHGAFARASFRRPSVFVAHAVAGVSRVG
jgi:galactokinase